MNTYNKVALALGGNIGNTLEHFKRAINHLIENGFIINKSSSVYTTPAVNCEQGANNFYNCVITGYWKNQPKELLSLCQKTESSIGRPAKHSSNESRIIDIDIILFKNKTINTNTLSIPHPRAHRRLFVLIPLNEIAASWSFPTLKSDTEVLLNSLKIKETELYYKINNTKQKINLSL
jgi:2-amino-4-hydroxy-6-hydroxymethyldihydropteridine diphosphokinase